MLRPRASLRFARLLLSCVGRELVRIGGLILSRIEGGTDEHGATNVVQAEVLRSQPDHFISLHLITPSHECSEIHRRCAVFRRSAPIAAPTATGSAGSAAPSRARTRIRSPTWHRTWHRA